MIKDKFICPECGLPKHLEFDGNNTYENFLELLNNTPQEPSNYERFTNWSITEENYNSVAQDIVNRYFYVYPNGDIANWFNTNVICLIKK